MGGSNSKQQSCNILLLGLDNAGKTSLLARLLGEEVRTILPTFGFSVRTFTLGSNKLHLKLWDLGGSSNVRCYWPAYYAKADAIAYVIDTTDRHRLAETSAVLQHLLDDEELLGLPLLVFANKQDVPNAIKAAEIEELMHLGSIRDRMWRCNACTALRGAGILDGLQWLSDSHTQIHAHARRQTRRERWRRARSASRSRLSESSAPDTAPVFRRGEASKSATALARARTRRAVPTGAPAEDDVGSDDSDDSDEDR